ncbi:hypothetical protein [Desulfovibrio inopinatus]|uniref:hypothetical protein n=1 Tax=Desulfovibrio inopinatus TaxID=102109 RepID=UPI0004810BB4|nr:hypothetical protein [Desulfovibrio inopinatus]
MMHRMILSPDDYNLAFMEGVLIIKETYGIKYMDALQVTHGSFERMFFAYASRIITDGCVKDGCAIIILSRISPHEPAPWY